MWWFRSGDTRHRRRIAAAERIPPLTPVVVAKPKGSPGWHGVVVTCRIASAVLGTRVVAVHHCPDGGVRTMSQSELATGLGLSRGVALHVDDLGMCHGANRAFLDLAARGLVSCGSVMVPCPWFLEIADAAVADPSLDVGVH